MGTKSEAKTTSGQEIKSTAQRASNYDDPIICIEDILDIINDCNTDISNDKEEREGE